MNRELKRQLLIQDGRHATRLYAQGKNCAQACEALGRSRQTLWRACKAFADAHPDEVQAIMRTAGNEYCDFPNCTADCWKRCTINAPCWDGRDSHLERDAWRRAHPDRVRPGRVVPPAENDPLLDGWYESVTPVTDSDDDELLA